MQARTVIALGVQLSPVPSSTNSTWSIKVADGLRAIRTPIFSREEFPVEFSAPVAPARGCRASAPKITTPFGPAPVAAGEKAALMPLGVLIDALPLAAPYKASNRVLATVVVTDGAV